MSEQGYAVDYPALVDQDDLDAYRAAHTEHYRRIACADILLVVNTNNKGRPNYIGPSVFAEIAFAIGLRLTHGKEVQIYCTNAIPEYLPYTEELLAWQHLGWLQEWRTA